MWADWLKGKKKNNFRCLSVEDWQDERDGFQSWKLCWSPAAVLEGKQVELGMFQFSKERKVADLIYCGCLLRYEKNVISAHDIMLVDLNVKSVLFWVKARTYIKGFVFSALSLFTDQSVQHSACMLFGAAGWWTPPAFHFVLFGNLKPLL